MTIVRPSSFPDFALQDQNDPVTGSPNIVEPGGELKNSGWLRQQKPPYQFFNWIHRLTNNWLKYLDNRAVTYDIIEPVFTFNQFDPAIDPVTTLLIRNNQTREVILYIPQFHGVSNDPALESLTPQWDGGDLGTKYLPVETFMTPVCIIQTDTTDARSGLLQMGSGDGTIEIHPFVVSGTEVKRGYFATENSKGLARTFIKYISKEST